MIQHGFCIPNLLNKYIFCHNFVFSFCPAGLLLMFTFTLIRCIGKEIGSHKSIFFRCLFHCQRNIQLFLILCSVLCFLCNSVIYSSSFSLSCSSQATKTKHCLDQSDMLLLFSHPVSLYMCNNSRNGANLSGSFIFYSLTFFYILRIILPFHQNIFRNFTNKKMDISKIIHDRSTPCIANQIQIRIFINDG